MPTKKPTVAATRDERVTVRLTAALRDRLEKLAQREQRTLASWIVIALEAAATSAEARK